MSAFGLVCLYWLVKKHLILRIVVKTRRMSNEGSTSEAGVNAAALNTTCPHSTFLLYRCSVAIRYTDHSDIDMRELTVSKFRILTIICVFSLDYGTGILIP